MFPGIILYISLAVVAAIDLAWLAVTDISIRQDSVFPVVIPIMLIGAMAVGARALSVYFERIMPPQSRAASKAYFDILIVVFHGLFFIRAAWLFLSLLNYLSMSLAFPYTDTILFAADRALFPDWKGYFAFVADRPFLVVILGISYGLLTPISVIVFLGMMLGRQTRRAEFYITGFFITALICITAGMFFPAVGSVMHILGGHVPSGRFEGVPGVYHVPILEKLRGSGPVALDLNDLPGLVTFPSFHTAAGIALFWSQRRTRLFWPALAYAAVMIASTPVIGGHYFIDLLGGGVIAVAILAWLGRLPRYRGLFRPDLSPQESERIA